MVSDEVDLIVWSSGHLDDASMIPSTESPDGKGPQRSMCTFSQGLDIGRLVNCMGATSKNSCICLPHVNYESDIISFGNCYDWRDPRSRFINFFNGLTFGSMCSCN